MRPGKKIKALGSFLIVAFLCVLESFSSLDSFRHTKALGGPVSLEILDCPGEDLRRAGWDWCWEVRPGCTAKKGRKVTQGESMWRVWGPVHLLEEDDVRSVLWNCTQCWKLFLWGEVPYVYGLEGSRSSTPSVVCWCLLGRVEQLLFLDSRTGYMLFLLSPNIKWVTSPRSKEWKLGMCSSLCCTNCINNKAYAKWIKDAISKVSLQSLK